jgi:hypothetical protein
MPSARVGRHDDQGFRRNARRMIWRYGNAGSCSRGPGHPEGRISNSHAVFGILLRGRTGASDMVLLEWATPGKTASRRSSRRCPRKNIEGQRSITPSARLVTRSWQRIGQATSARAGADRLRVVDWPAPKTPGKPAQRPGRRTPPS